jgi:Protein of unknown function (DUF2950)
MPRTVCTHAIERPGVRIIAALLMLVLVVALESCGKLQQKTAGTSAQKTFASPDDAGVALFTAAKSGDQSQLVEMFGPNSAAVLLTGEPATDKARLNDFATAYGQMHRWGDIKAGGQVLIVGAENIVFPIPLGKNSSGRWYFDTAAGNDEILARRIGKNELTAIDATRALAEAQQKYHREPHDGDKVKQYAQKFVSDPGKQNGLYWPVADGQSPSPPGQLGDFGKMQSFANAGTDAVFNGYRYRILNKGQTATGVKDYIVDGKMTGGFAILAWPIEYRTSGIASFLIGPDGALYQKDLGENTGNLAASVIEYNPSDGWAPAGTLATSASRMQQ